MTKRILTMALALASFATVAPAAVVYGGVGYGARDVKMRHSFSEAITLRLMNINF